MVATGAPGGVGRYELLAARALSELQDAGEIVLDGIARREHPSYLSPEREEVFPSRGRHANGHRSAEPLPIRRFALRTLRSIRATKPDLVLFTHVNLAQLAPSLTVLCPGARSLTATYGVEVWERLGWNKRAGLRAADRVLTISSYTHRQLVERQGLRHEKVVTIPLCLDPAWVDAAERILVRSNGADRTAAGKLLTVGRLAATERAKGIDWVIRALPQLAREVPDISYTVVGDGDDVPRLKALAQDIGVGDRVLFAGRLDYRELLEAYADCDVFVLPSAKEGFGLVFLEAMAFRKPVVARAEKGALDVIVDGETGLLVGDERELGSALLTLVRAPARATTMGRAGFARLATEFSFPTYRDRMYELISCVWGESRCNQRASLTR